MARWQEQCRENSFHNILSKLVVFMLIIIIPVKGGDHAWAGDVKPYMLSSTETSPTPAAPDSPCGPGGASLLWPLGFLSPKAVWRWLTAIGQQHVRHERSCSRTSGGRGSPQALPLRWSMRGSMEPLPQLRTIFFQCNFRVALQYWCGAWLSLCIAGCVLIEQMPGGPILTQLELVKMRNEWSFQNQLFV